MMGTDPFLCIEIADPYPFADTDVVVKGGSIHRRSPLDFKVRGYVPPFPTVAAPLYIIKLI